MAIVSRIRGQANFALELRNFLRETVTLDQANAIVRERMAQRETSFLNIVKRCIFDHPTSPYLPLLKLAGCELGDIHNLVRDKGVEATLRDLREAGVFVTYEEFRGLHPIVRNGQTIPVQPSDFDNPAVAAHFVAQTGGSSGPGVQVANNLHNVAALTPHHIVTRNMHGVADIPAAIWRGILPDSSGVKNILRSLRMGQVPERWFSQLVPSGPRDLKGYLASQFVVATGRLYGAPIPWPEWVPIDQAITVARWVEEALRRRGKCLVMTQVSRALRVSIAAEEAGIDLSGATFMIAGEPPTPAKVHGITRGGAKHFPTYGFHEVSRIGMGCGNTTDCNDVHVLKDAFALIQWPRQLSGSDVVVPAFNITTLLPTAPKVAVNVEADDYGVLERRACGCELAALGFDEHLRDIRSFSKLTGEGVTLVGSEMVRILEEVLPARFGGSPLDYQLVEEEDEQGFTRLSLWVDPKIQITDDSEVTRALLDALRRARRAGGGAPYTMWKQAGTLRVVRKSPTWTNRGKLMPLHIVRPSAKKESEREQTHIT